MFYKYNRHNEQHALPHKLSEKAVISLPLKLQTGRIKPLRLQLLAAFAEISEKLKKSFTVDNGKEFTAHKELAAGTGMEVFFCDPYSPWQRGTNENTNGLLRQFFPKEDFL